MDHQGSSCILPSNAPSAFHEHGLPDHVPYRVLQEACGNRGVESDRGFQYPKAEYTLPSENVFLNHVRRESKRTEEDKDREANRLWRHLNRCKQYVKYRNRKPKEAMPNQDIKWPEHMEIAFCRALVEYPPIGRRKMQIGSDASSTKARGRNELIADFIMRLTGETRTRKQVSSHIQVLKPMVKDDEFIMHYLAGDEQPSTSRHRRHANHSLYRHHSNHHGRRLYQPPTPDSPYSHHQSYAAPVTHPVTQDPLRLAHEPIHFHMFIHSTSVNPPEILHHITHLRSPSARDPDMNIPSTKLMKEFLPALWPLCEAGALADCQVICATASLAIPAPPPKGAELGIEFEIRTDAGVCDLRGFEGFESEMAFWTGGREVRREKKGVEFEEGYGRLGNIWFFSKFWAELVIRLGNKVREVRQRRDRVGEMGIDGKEREVQLRAASELEREVRSELEKLSAVQEISARVKDDGEESRRRLLVVHWNFKHAEPRQPGELRWQNVVCDAFGTSVKKEESGLSIKGEQDWKLPIDFDTTMAMTNLHHPSSTGTLIPGFGHLTNNHNGFDLDALDGLPSLSTLNTGINGDMASPSTYQPPSLYPANVIDFTGGHINLSFDAVHPNGSVNDQPLSALTGTTDSNDFDSFAPAPTHHATTAGSSAFTQANDIGASQPSSHAVHAHSQHQPVLYAPQPHHPVTQQWHSAYSQGPYFDLSGFDDGQQNGSQGAGVVSQGHGGHVYGSFSVESDATEGHSFGHGDGEGVIVQSVEFEGSGV